MRRSLTPWLAFMFGLTGCAPKPLHRAELCTAPADLPVIGTTRDGREYLDLTVLIYNVEGLPWPARKNRGAKLDAIGDEVARRRAAGMAPEIVLLQEVFTRRAAKIGLRSGYRNIVSGPDGGDRRRAPASGVPADFKAARRFFKGERTRKLLGSGLQVLSDYPVKAYYREPFSANACAGYDCLANKGVMLARVCLPGLRTPVDVFTTHMNAQKASGVDLKRAHAAHRFQTDQSAAFLARASGPRARSGESAYLRRRLQHASRARPAGSLHLPQALPHRAPLLHGRRQRLRCSDVMERRRALAGHAGSPGLRRRRPRNGAGAARGGQVRPSSEWWKTIRP